MDNNMDNDMEIDEVRELSSLDCYDMLENQFEIDEYNNIQFDIDDLCNNN